MYVLPRGAQRRFGMVARLHDGQQGVAFAEVVWGAGGGDVRSCVAAAFGDGDDVVDVDLGVRESCRPAEVAGSVVSFDECLRD